MAKFLDDNGLLYFWQKIKNAFVAKVNGKGLSTNDYTTEEKSKLAGLENYTLPTASADTKGGVKVGAGLSITEGVLSTTGGGVADSVEWDDIQNKPTFAPANAEQNVQSDWNATDPTSDAYIANKPTIPSSAADIGAIAAAVKGQANGVASLDSDGLVPSSQLPSYVDDVIEGYFFDGVFYEESTHTTAIAGATGKIYVDLATNLSYRYGGSVYVLITSADAVAITNAEIDTIVAT